MDIQLLEDIGLTMAQALTYKALVEKGASSAPVIAEHIKESRSNTYKVLDRLCELGLATKDTTGTKVRYSPTNPAALEQLINDQAAQVQLRERKLTAALPGLLDYFFAHSEQPGIRFYQGKEKIKQMYSEMLATGQTLYLLRTPTDVGFYDEGFFAELRNKRRLLGIKTIGMTPDVPSANHDPKIDARNGFIRTWVPAEAYTANVEWNIAGNKVGLISYGEEAMGVLIESAQIAESFRQMFRLASAQVTNDLRAPNA
jgi:sugar-specific transcriptional regulator TrmB